MNKDSLVYFSIIAGVMTFITIATIRNDPLIAAESVVAAATFYMAWQTRKTIEEMQRDKRLKLIEKRLEEFYMPLINLFSSHAFKTYKDVKKVNEIITEKRWLAGPKAAEKLPKEFNAICKNDFFYLSEYHFSEWEEAAGAIWDEAMQFVEEYYKIGGIKEYTIPEGKPRWAFEKKITGIHIER